MKITSSVVWTIICLLTSPLLIAQEDRRPYDPLSDRISRAIMAELPDWKRKSVPPLNQNGLDTFSQEMFIDQWSSKEGNVKVVLFRYSSDAEAKNAFEKFTAGVRAHERIPELEIEGYAWGLNKSIALRRGRYAAYISAIALNVSSNGTSSDKRPKEEAKLSRMFAKLVSKAFKDLD